MNYEIEKIDKDKVKIDLTLTAAEWKEEVDAAYNKNKAKYNVAGFRAGKAPKARIEKEYGESVFFNDALSDGFYKHYIQILDKERHIEPIDAPKIDVLDISENGVTLRAIVTVYPELKISKYKGLNIVSEAKTVTESDIQSEIDALLNQQIRFVEQDKAIENGDVANIDFEGSVDGVVFAGGTAKGFDLEIGSGSFIEGFEPQLVGLKAGEEKDINVTFPEQYHAKDLAGKPAVFKINVNSVKVKQKPELTDELISDATEFNTVEEFKSNLKLTLAAKFENDAKVERDEKILEAVLNNTEVELPESLIEHEVDHIIGHFEGQLHYQGLNLADYLNYLGVNEAEFKQERREDAIKNVKLRLAMQEIVKLEKLEISNEDTNEYIAQLAKNAKLSEKEYRQRLDDHAWGHINNDIIMNKVLKFLSENN